MWLEAKPCHGDGLGARSGMGGKIGGGKMRLFPGGVSKAAAAAAAGGLK